MTDDHSLLALATKEDQSADEVHCKIPLHHPLLNGFDILDQVLAQHQKENFGLLDNNASCTESSNVSSGKNKRRKTERVQEILKIADFLFGPLLDAALDVLEQPPTMTENDANRSENPASDEPRDRCTALRQLFRNTSIVNLTATPSGREAFLVKGSHHFNISNTTPLTNRCVGKLPSYYLCLMNGQQLFCSCRGFNRNFKSSVTSTRTGEIHSSGESLVICKHLLAIKLSQCFESVKGKKVSDREFGEVLADISD